MQRSFRCLRVGWQRYCYIYSGEGVTKPQDVLLQISDHCSHVVVYRDFLAGSVGNKNEDDVECIGVIHEQTGTHFLDTWTWVDEQTVDGDGVVKTHDDDEISQTSTVSEGSSRLTQTYILKFLLSNCPKVPLIELCRSLLLLFKEQHKTYCHSRNHKKSNEDECLPNIVLDDLFGRSDVSADFAAIRMHLEIPQLDR